MENLLRTAALDWLRADSALSGINCVAEESINAATPPWLSLVASASADWGTKDRTGREIRLAFELETRADQPDADSATLTAIEQRILAMPRSNVGFEIASIRFLRARSERRPKNRRGALLEFRFRLLEPLSE